MQQILPGLLSQGQARPWKKVMLCMFVEDISMDYTYHPWDYYPYHISEEGQNILKNFWPSIGIFVEGQGQKLNFMYTSPIFINIQNLRVLSKKCCLSYSRIKRIFRVKRPPCFILKKPGLTLKKSFKAKVLHAYRGYINALHRWSLRSSTFCIWELGQQVSKNADDL